VEVDHESGSMMIGSVDAKGSFEPQSDDGGNMLANSLRSRSCYEWV